VGKLFKLANAEATDTYYFGGEEEEDRDGIRVRSSISNNEAHQMLKHVPTDTGNVEGGLQFIERIFDKVIVAWSLTDEQGNVMEPCAESLRRMDASGARQIEDKVAQHFNKLLGREVEKAEGESSS
jgi:hypothetical protein